MIEWKNELKKYADTNERVSEWMNEWNNKCMNECMNEWINEWKGKTVRESASNWLIDRLNAVEQ